MTAIASSTPLEDDSKSVNDKEELSDDDDEDIMAAVMKLGGNDDALAKAYKDILNEPVSPEQPTCEKSCIRAFKH